MSPDDNRRAWVEQVMGMPVSIHLRGSAGPDRRQAAVRAAFAELRAVDRVFSTYRPDSDLSRLRRGELTLDECDPTLAEVAALCEEATAATDGYFDAWLPGPDTVIRFDPTGLVKGWAVQRVTRFLTALERDDFYVNAGGDIALGRATAPAGPGREWRIGVQDPRHDAGLVAILRRRDGAIATSGGQYRGRHIINPHSGQPVDGLRSVTVTGPSLMWADVLATAAYARGPDGLSGYAWPSGYHALAVGPDGQTSVTPGIDAASIGWTGRPAPALSTVD